jgi:hypothetical protein
MWRLGESREEIWHWILGGGKTMPQGMIRALAFFLCMHATAMVVYVRAEPYKGESYPPDILMFKSLKRVLTETGRLYFGELRLVGKNISRSGNRQIFFCVGLKENFVDITHKRQVIVPRFVENRPLSEDDIQGDLDLYADCSVFDILRLDSGIWILQQGAQFIVIEQ